MKTRPVETIVDAVDAALSEIGYIDAVRKPTRAERQKYPGWRIMLDMRVPNLLGWRASALYRLHTEGPESMIRCVHRSGSANWWTPPCPLHPVGGLLAGVDRGCADAT